MRSISLFLLLSLLLGGDPHQVAGLLVLPPPDHRVHEVVVQVDEDEEVAIAPEEVFEDESVAADATAELAEAEALRRSSRR